MTIFLDGSLMHDRESVHTQVQERLALPAHYGRNLDALYDVLSVWADPLTINVVHWGSMEEALGLYAEAFAEALLDAAKSNSTLRVHIQ